MRIGRVIVIVLERIVTVRVKMFALDVPDMIVRVMLVVVAMQMGMLERAMPVAMRVSFGRVEDDADGH